MTLLMTAASTGLRSLMLTMGVAGTAILTPTMARATDTEPNRSALSAPAAARELTIDAQTAAERLAGAVRIRTISLDDQPASPAVFRELHDYIVRQYPNLHRVLRREIVNGSSLLYTWQGSDPTSPSILLLAHQDVISVEPGTETQWQHAPFSGDIADGYIWGRGSWDDKGNLFSMLEAVELLVTRNFKPRSTIYLAFGHDEETGPTAGQHGAHEIAALLNGRGVHVATVLDEGLLISHDAMKGLDKPVALIGIAEKGYITLDVSTKAAAGHSSMPPTRMAIGRLSAALTRIEQHPFPLQITPVIREMFETLAPEFHGINGMALSNLWLFAPFVRRQVAATPGGNAMLHTTIALTTVQAGNSDHALPAQAKATVNFRTMPGDSIQDVISHTIEAVDDVSVHVVPSGIAWEASRTSSTHSPGYLQLSQTIQEVFPGVLVAPGLMVGATDSRHYLGLADDVYRFTPVHAWPDDLPRFHGANERLSIANYADMIRFYFRLLSSPGVDKNR